MDGQVRTLGDKIARQVYVKTVGRRETTAADADELDPAGGRAQTREDQKA